MNGRHREDVTRKGNREATRANDEEAGARANESESVQLADGPVKELASRAGRNGSNRVPARPPAPTGKGERRTLKRGGQAEGEGEKEREREKGRGRKRARGATRHG